VPLQSQEARALRECAPQGGLLSLIAQRRLATSSIGWPCEAASAMGFQKGFDPYVIGIAVSVILGAVLVMVAMMKCLNLFTEGGDGTVVSETSTKEMKKAV
jgi:hypothetical protein